MNTPDAFNPSKATDSQDPHKGAWMGLLGALAKSVISTIVKGRKGFLTPHRNCPSHPDQVTAMNNTARMIPVSQHSFGPSQVLESIIRRRDEAFGLMTPHQREVIQQSHISEHKVNELFGKARQLAGV